MSTAAENPMLSRLECPVCLEYMRPPIRQCENRHALCQDCFYQVIKCPICRQSKIHVRSKTLEVLYRTLNIPCRYKSEGCGFTAKGDGGEIKKHEKGCVFCPRTCPLLNMEGCKWVGPLAHRPKHCKESHTDKDFRPGAIVKASNFKQNSTSRRYLTIHFAGHHMFKCYFGVNEGGIIKFSVQVDPWAPFNESDRFTYKIEFFKGDSLEVGLTLEGRCRFSETESGIVVGWKYESDHYAELNDYCTSEGHLRYTIKIFDSTCGYIGNYPHDS